MIFKGVVFVLGGFFKVRGFFLVFSCFSIRLAWVWFEEGLILVWFRKVVELGSVCLRV